ncbi:hypothetical protein [Neisseria wadsworthii]|uniref:hypothetical protein n=1 Tax=Neisseria wadsworthii TaxID=607711 RepID=UPI000D321E91|nr:hypothetical protein [Neisseria wadsworthii]
MKYKNFVTPLLLAFVLSACGSGQPDNELSSSEEQAHIESASGAYADASEAPPPDMLPDDYASGEAPQDYDNLIPADGNRTVSYRSDKGAATAVYDNSGEMPVVRLTVGNQPETVLKQTDALPQGAIYSNGSITWETDGSSAKLTQGGSSTNFKEAQASDQTAPASAASGK